MFYTAASLAKAESFVLQKVDAIAFFASCDPGSEAQWTSDKNGAKQFKSIVDAVSQARNLNLNKVIVIRNLYQVIEVEVEQPVVIQPR